MYLREHPFYELSSTKASRRRAGALRSPGPEVELRKADAAIDDKPYQHTPLLRLKI
jgi:hypothetical protein